MSIMEQNNDYAWALSEFLDQRPRFITAEMIHEADPEDRLPKETVWTALAADALKLSDFAINEYLRPGVRLLSAGDFLSNPYISGIDFPERYNNGWRLTHLRYSPYEAFLRDDIKFTASLREIPQIGFFDRLVSYPAVLQDGREWMAVKPSEIASMKKAIEGVRGDVLVFGLGLGYFPFMVSARAEVRSVTIVELDPDVIRLFKSYLLPQFPHSEKIEIVCQDAFVFMEELSTEGARHFDSAFVDIWHDAQDGPERYLKARTLMSALGIETWYWAENSMISALRWKAGHEG